MNYWKCREGQKRTVSSHAPWSLNSYTVEVFTNSDPHRVSTATLNEDEGGVDADKYNDGMPP